MIKPPVTCFVVDDDDAIRNSLSLLLRSLGYRVETFDSADAFLDRKRRSGIGCLILDVRMPGMSGMDLQDALAAAGDPLPVIFLTGHDDLPLGISAMKKGAVDFLTKPFDDDVLAAAIESAIEKHRRARQRHEEMVEIHRRLERLSPRELEVLRHVISGRLNKQIAGTLGISEQTVKIHRGRIMKKLEIASVADLVRLAEKAGIASAR